MEKAKIYQITLSRAERARLNWRKAYASTFNGQCVEVAKFPGGIVMRDSKDPDGPILVYTVAAFKAFLDGARNGEFGKHLQ